MGVNRWDEIALHESRHRAGLKRCQLLAEGKGNAARRGLTCLSADRADTRTRVQGGAGREACLRRGRGRQG